MELREFDLKDMEKLQQAERELKITTTESTRLHQELQDLRSKLVQLHSEQRVLD